MGRIDETFMEDVLQQDELEARAQQADARKRRKKRIRKRRRRILLLLFLLAVVGYFISDYSKVRVIEVKGNVFYTKKQVMEKAKLSYSMKSIMAPGFLISKRLEDDPMIKEVSVEKTWDGVISIQVVEEKLSGYYIKDKKAYLIIEGEEDEYIEDESSLATVPFIVDLNKKQLQEYKKAIQEVKASNIRLISEVSHYETSYDNNMLKLVMQDGHIVYTSIQGLSNLNYYNDILQGLNTTHRCIVFAEETNSAYSEKCE